jgi:hypothetical protein
MSRTSRYAARAAALAAVSVTTALTLVAPASAAPANDSWEYCREPIDGAVLCITATPDPVSGVAAVTSSLTIEPGRRFGYALMYLSRCPVAGTPLDCENLPPLIAREPEHPVTASWPSDDDYYYWASVNWRDDQWHTHVGVQLETPHPEPEQSP